MKLGKRYGISFSVFLDTELNEENKMTVDTRTQVLEYITLNDI
jgi:hypothetical protein